MLPKLENCSLNLKIENWKKSQSSKPVNPKWRKSIDLCLGVCSLQTAELAGFFATDAQIFHCLGKNLKNYVRLCVYVFSMWSKKHGVFPFPLRWYRADFSKRWYRTSAGDRSLFSNPRVAPGAIQGLTLSGSYQISRICRTSLKIVDWVWKLRIEKSPMLPNFHSSHLPWPFQGHIKLAGSVGL